MLRARIKNSIRSFQKVGGGFVGLLDTYGGAAAAYSFRRLSSTYTGNLIEVRRSSDNTIQDIGYDANGDLDTSALLSFVGAGDGFVRTWYDQSGNANNAQQTTTSNQPQIVSSGSTILENGKPALNFNSDKLNATFSKSIPFTVFTAVTTPSNISSRQSFYDLGGGTIAVSLEFDNSTLRQNAGIMVNIVAINANTQYSVSSLWNGASSFASVNGNVYNINPGNRSANLISLGQYDRNDFALLNAKYQELIIYSTDQTANRTGIETNINSYYSIY